MRTVWHHPRFPIAFLAGVVVLITVADWVFDFSQAMMVPLLVEESWDQLKSGNFSNINLWPFFTLISHAFLHADLEHLFGNMLFFWIFGSVILEICGFRWMLAIFFLTAIGGAMGQILIEGRGSIIPMLGASGTVMGFEGAYLGLVVQKSRPNPFVWPMARPISPANLAALGVASVVLDMMGILQQSPGSSIAYAAHIGGFVTGIFVSILRKD